MSTGQQVPFLEALNPQFAARVTIQLVIGKGRSVTTIEDITSKLHNLPPDTLGEVEDFVMFLISKHRASAKEWPQRYFEDVLGSVLDFPDVDNVGGIDASLDEAKEELVFDAPPRLTLGHAAHATAAADQEGRPE